MTTKGNNDMTNSNNTTTITSDDRWSTWTVDRLSATRFVVKSQTGRTFHTVGEFDASDLPATGSWNPEFLRAFPRAIGEDAVTEIRRLLSGAPLFTAPTAAQQREMDREERDMGRRIRRAIRRGNF